MPKRSHRKITQGAQTPRSRLPVRRHAELSWVAHEPRAHTRSRSPFASVAGYGVTIAPQRVHPRVASGQDPFSSGPADERTVRGHRRSKRIFERWRTLPTAVLRPRSAGAGAQRWRLLPPFEGPPGEAGSNGQGSLLHPPGPERRS